MPRRSFPEIIVYVAHKHPVKCSEDSPCVLGSLCSTLKYRISFSPESVRICLLSVVQSSAWIKLVLRLSVACRWYS